MIIKQQFIILLDSQKNRNQLWVFLNWHCQHWCYNTIFETRKMENIFSKNLASGSLTPHNSSDEIILDNVKLQSETDLKSCNLGCF